MGIFDIFSNTNAQSAADHQIAGIQSGQASAIPSLYQGVNALNTNYTAALQPYLTNYNNAQGGVTALGNVLGLNGAAGSQSALTALQNTPGYQFQKQQGDSALTAQAAATGQLASGNTALALSNYDQGLASTTYNNYVSQLQPYLSASNAAAGGINGTYTGLGNALTGQYNNIAGLNYTANTGIGNAQANADLANNNASANFWNMLGSIGGMKTSGGGTVGGQALSSLGSAASGVGSSVASGIGDAASALFGIFSDERLKENIEPVGKMFDGTNVYRYNYKGDDVPRIGVMAQEVEKTRPDAVVEIGGFKAVDYGKATDLAASLARFVDDSVARRDDRRGKPGNDFDLSRFLEAA